MYPPVPSMPTPATYQNNVFPPYYNPGPYSPPVMQPSVPFGPQAPATGSNNMIPPYYGYYHSNSWYHHSAPAPHVNVPASIKKEAANLTYPPDGEKGENNSDWLVKGFDWPGWQVVATNTSEVALLKKGLKETVEDAGQSWKVVVSKHFKEQKKLLGFLNNLKTDFNKCKCVIALTKWFEAIGLSSNFGTYFKNWLNEIVKPDHGGNLNNIWNSQHQHQQQSHYNTPGYHGDPYLMYPYSMNSPNYFSSNPYAPNVNNVYGSWSAGISYPLTSMSNSLFGTIYPNVDTPYNNPHQHQWPASGSYPNGSPFFDAASQVDKKPVSITQQNSSTTNTNPLNVSVTFDLRQFNVSMCKSTVTKQHPVTLEDLLTKASQTNSCFTFTTVIYINNARREGKYLDSINGISVTDTTTWIISKRNGASDLNLDFEPASGDYFIINNTSV
ncbi:uncharacterized protein LOC106871109 [Octopus bimaculoides]|nr:uncharacterized protein LOC106871109 [Octopus bimaculoides]|eukprot:XP_014772898.1 PREDICTED: uncharacterized protein LOC106871109 [Octopus bimaculoides]